MLDPFWSAPSTIARLVQPLAESLDLYTLPLHAHEVVLAFSFYSLLYVAIAPAASRRLFPSVYPQLSGRSQINWNVRCVSTVQSSFITLCALWVINKDERRAELDWQGRLWGYTGAGGMVQAFAAGYFLWDLAVSATSLGVLGLGSLVHAFSALLVTSLGFRPFANFYGLNFILYELSTPFLNINWFLDKLGLTGSPAQLCNAVALITTFAGSRILWGTYQSVLIYMDVWTAITSGHPPNAADDLHTSKLEHSLPLGRHTMPTWLVILYLGGNTTLSFLNVYWFGLMISAIKKRFTSAEAKDKTQ
ncbi:MAG: hypothetical protein M1837_004118 [Sclerophora amabilis]|nr:MAG: hypothetical protein M1837_004118 [Sclerophora amabilis]